MCWLIMLFLVVWIGSLFFFFVCCKLIKLEVVWCVLALRRTKNNSADGLCFDALHVFWIWQAWQKEVEDNIDEERGGMTT